MVQIHVCRLALTNVHLNLSIRELNRLRAVSCFSLQSYCTRNLSKRAAKPRAARNEGVSPRRKIFFFSRLVSVIIKSWFVIALDEIRTRGILREKADCKQSRSLKEQRHEIYQNSKSANCAHCLQIERNITITAQNKKRSYK